MTCIHISMNTGVRRASWTRHAGSLRQPFPFPESTITQMERLTHERLRSPVIFQMKMSSMRPPVEIINKHCCGLPAALAGFREGCQGSVGSVIECDDGDGLIALISPVRLWLYFGNRGK